MLRDDVSGWAVWRIVPRLAGGVVSVPVVAGFVVLGAAVLVGRSLRGVARDAWALLPTRRANPQPEEHADAA